MSKLADAISQLTPEQRALLEKRLREKRKQQQSTTSQISQRADTTLYPLSAGQQRLWLLDQMSSDPGSIMLSETLRLRGSLNLDILEQSIAQIAHRHAILRVQFKTIDGEPVQTIGPLPDTLVHFIDEGNGPDEERLERSLQKIKAEKVRPFNMTDGPLWRVTLIRISESDHVLLLTMHHIISDGWSMGIFFEELSRFYVQKASNGSQQVEPLAIQYADFANWQNKWLEGDEARQQLAYWEDKLSSGLQPLKYPFDTTAAGSQSNMGAQETLVFSPELAEALQGISRKENVTLFSTLLTAFNTTLYQYTAQEEMLLCTPTAGRRRTEVENLIGYFNNICTLHLELSNGSSLGSPTFSELLKRNNDVVVGAYDHQDIPFQQITRLPNLARIPLTRAFFALEDSLEQTLKLPNVDVELLDLGGEPADFDLALYMVQNSESSQSGLKAYLIYRESLFNHDDIRQFLDHYKTTLILLAEQPNTRLSELPTLLSHRTPEHPANQDLPDIATEPMLNGSSATNAYKNGSYSLVNDSSSTANGQTVLPDFAPDAAMADARISPVHLNASITLPRTELETHLIGIWEELLGVQPIGVEQDFFALGGHSMLAVHLVDEIKRQITGQTVPLSLLLQASTVADMARVLENNSLGEWSPLVQIKQGDPTRPALFCVHGAGGNVLTYRELAHYLDPDQTVFGLQTQGLDGKLPLLDSVEEMATLYRTHIQRVQPQGPYMLTGYCMGGTVALEIAQQLRAQGHEVGLLGLLETYNWHVMREESLWDKTYYWLQKFDFHWRNFIMLGRAQKRLFLGEKWAALKDRTKVWRGAVGGPSKNRDGSDESDQNALIAAVWANNDEVSIKYQPTQYDGKITTFTPTKEYSIYTSQDTGWEKLAINVEKKVLPVYPAGMLLEPFVATLAEEMSKSIEAVLGS